MGIARYLSKLASGLSSEGVVSAAKGGTGSTSGATGGGGPKITTITVTDSSYNNLDDTAVDVAGGYIKLTGSGFASGCQVLVGSTPATSTTFVSSTEVRAQVPATTAGTYIVYLVNSDGGVAIRVNGVTFSTTPTWTTGSGLSASVNSQISIQLAATGASTFSVASGSSLPSGVSLSSSGLLSGSITGLTSPTTYTFTILATDAELQDSPRTFSFSISVGEPYFKYVSLLLSADGTNAAQNNTFVDSSTNNFTITRNGNTTQGTFTPYGPNWSNYLDSSSYLSSSTSTGYAFGTGDFTVEGWFFVTASADQGLFDTRASISSTTGVGARLITSTNTLRVILNNAALFTTSTAITLNTWNHIAIVRSSGTITAYLNGTAMTGGSATGTTNITDTSGIYVGKLIDAGYFFNGYISNFRVVKGTALYTGSFTPSIRPLTAVSGTSLLTCQSNRLIDSSINNLDITKNGDISVQRFSPFSPQYATTQAYSANLFTSGSIQLSSTSTNPQVTSSLGTAAFTVEGWYYPTTTLTGKNARILSYGRDSAGTDTTWDLYISNGTSLVWNRVNTTATTYSGNYTFTTNTWYHLVACRDSSNNFALFVNGTRVFFQANVTTDYTYISGSHSNHYIGASYNGTAWNYALGYYSNIRVIKTATAYDPTQATLTVPTQPLTATAQTIMLLLSSNTGTDITGNYPVFSNFNSAQVKPTIFSPFIALTTTASYSSSIYGGSGYFDGTGDYLTAPNNASLALGTGAFTVEIWLYILAYNASTSRIIDWRSNGGTPSNIPVLTLSASGVPQFYADVATGALITGSSAVALNTWAHLAIVRSGSTVTMYLNGTSIGSASSSLNLGVETLNLNDPAAGSTYGQRGYFSDIRVVKGTAVYTSNFIPPAQPLTAITNTSLLLSTTNANIIDSAMINNLETVGNVQLTTATKKYGTAAIAFDGTGDYLNIANSNQLNFGTGDFTVECWVYFNSLANTPMIWHKNASNSGWFFEVGTSSIYFGHGTASGTQYYQLTASLSTGTWYHLAVTRVGNILSIFINGVKYSSAVDGGENSVDNTAPFIIGSFQPNNGSYDLNGYIDDFRITKGYARYTANFTPPTSAHPLQ